MVFALLMWQMAPGSASEFVLVAAALARMPMPKLVSEEMLMKVLLSSLRLSVLVLMLALALALALVSMHVPVLVSFLTVRWVMQ